MKNPAGAGMMWLLLAAMPVAGQESSLSDLKLESTEAKLTLQTVTNENERLQGDLKMAQQQIKLLTESLAVANSEAEVFRRECTDLKLRMEALGLDAASPQKEKLEQRLLKAVRDLELLQMDRDKLANQMVMLCESVVRYLQTAESIDAQARVTLEEQLRSAGELIGLPGSKNEPQGQAIPLDNAQVISIKQELALVVANIGRKDGVEVGMPFQVWRGERRIGLVRVVDVREKISGAVIQNLESDKEPIKTGDRLRVDAR
jgi:hypothetical protein